jgi:saccharopine dehydrogenase-like NADP-dependent oxidoreductase
VQNLVNIARCSPITEKTARAYHSTVEMFCREDREHAKKLWAPVHTEVNKLRSEELKTLVHASPVFVRASFEDTLSHYVKHLNLHQHDKHAYLT